MLGVRLPIRTTVISLAGERPPKSIVVEATAVLANDRAVLHMPEAGHHPALRRKTSTR